MVIKDFFSYFYGVSEFLPQNDGIKVCRFNQQNAWAGLEGFMQDCAAGVRLAFRSDSSYLRLETILGKAEFEYGKGAFDLFIDGKYISTVTAPEPRTEGQKFEVFFSDLPHGMKEILLYFPTYRKTIIQKIELSDGSVVEPTRFHDGKRILFIGDSITQGYGATPAFCFAADYARRRKADFLNLGIGGAQFPTVLPDALSKERYLEVVIAFGTNDFFAERPLSDIESALTDMLTFFHGQRVTVFSPTASTRYAVEKYLPLTQLLKEVADKFEARFVSGLYVVPHDDAFFVDQLHPAPEGMRRMADALCSAFF